MSGDMPVYRKQGDPDVWLMYNPPSNQWCVRATEHKGTDINYTFIECIPPCLPERGPKGTWQVPDGSTCKWDVQAAIDVSIATPQEVVDAAALIAAAAEALAASVRADGHKVNEHTIYFRFSLFIKAHTLNNELLIISNNINYFLSLFYSFSLGKTHRWSYGNTCIYYQRHLRGH